MSLSGAGEVIWCESNDFHQRAAALIKSVSSVLDIGCGIRPQQFIRPEFLICVEPHPEYVEILKGNLQGANAIIVANDALGALRGMPDRSIDSIFLIDVIEHMEKAVGAQVLLECERVSRQQIIVFTPLGFMPQEVHAGALDGWNLHGGEWQDHKSGWYPEEFPDWSIVACKHLHTHDYLGQPIEPPYGGFYAIRNKPKVGSLFNEIYSFDTLTGQTSNLPWLAELYPDFVEKVVSRDIESSVLRCGLHACQRRTELQIELGGTSSAQDIANLIELEKSEAQREEARQHHERMRQFASQFAELNQYSLTADQYQEKLLALKGIEDSIASRESKLESQRIQQEAKEAELLKRLEELQAEQSSSVFAIGKRIRKLIK